MTIHYSNQAKDVLTYQSLTARQRERMKAPHTWCVTATFAHQLQPNVSLTDQNQRTLLCRGKAPGPTTDQKVTVSCRSAGLKVLQQYSDVIAHELGTVQSMTVRLAVGPNFIFPVLCRLQSREPLKQNFIT